MSCLVECGVRFSARVLFRYILLNFPSTSRLPPLHDLKAGFGQFRTTRFVGSFGNVEQLLKVELLRRMIAHLFGCFSRTIE